MATLRVHIPDFVPICLQARVEYVVLTTDVRCSHYPLDLVQTTATYSII